MEEETKMTLENALKEKRLNQTAHDEIVRWLSEEEFAELLAG